MIIYMIGKYGEGTLSVEAEGVVSNTGDYIGGNSDLNWDLNAVHGVALLPRQVHLPRLALFCFTTFHDADGLHGPDGQSS